MSTYYVLENVNIIYVKFTCHKKFTIQKKNLPCDSKQTLDAIYIK